MTDDGAYKILAEIEPSAAVGNTGAGFDDPALGFAIAASMAISLKRIADALWGVDGTSGLLQLLNPLDIRNNY